MRHLWLLALVAFVLIAVAAADRLAGEIRAVGPGTTERVSVASGGSHHDDGGGSPSVSADGRFVAFVSTGDPVAGDENPLADVFVRDRQAQTTELISVASDGTQAWGGASLEPAISADGRYVAFSSSAIMVDGDTNWADDVFVHDRQTGNTERVSVTSGGGEAGFGGYHSGEPSISTDGRYVAFSSWANNLVPGDTNLEDVFVHDRQTHVTERVSVASDDGDHFGGGDPSISADGRYVSFTSHLSSDWLADVFVRDRLSATTELVSVASSGDQTTNGSSHSSAISGDGRFVAFIGQEHLMPVSVFVRNRQTQTTEQISVPFNGSQLSNLWDPTISSDGRYVAFSAYALPWKSDVFVRDRQAGTTELVSVASNGTEANSSSDDPVIAPSGRYIAFSSAANNLVPGDTNFSKDVFVRDRGGTGGTPTATPTPTPTQPAGENRKVIFIQGIDSESGECGFSFRPDVSWMVDSLLKSNTVKQSAPSLDSKQDFFYFSYSDQYCPGDGTIGDIYSKPQYGKRNTCNGIGFASVELESMVFALVAEYPDARFDIIGHSMGGLVASYWLSQHPGRAGRVHSIVTFDSPLRGLPAYYQVGNYEVAYKNPGSVCDHDGLSWTDLECDDYSQSTKRDKCKSTVVEAIASMGNLTAYYTIDSTQGEDWPLPGPLPGHVDTWVEAVPENRTTLLGSNSELHCKFDNNHSTVWTESGLDSDLVSCWPDFRWSVYPPKPSNGSPRSDTKATFLACAIAGESGPSCMADLGTFLLPDTITDEGSPAGSNVLHASNSGFHTGDTIVLNPGMPNEEQNTVTGDPAPVSRTACFLTIMPHRPRPCTGARSPQG